MQAVNDYKHFQEKYPQAIVLMKMGDFYEVIGDKAAAMASTFNLALTTRDNLPMCSFAYHQLEPITARLVRDGSFVAIVEPTSKPLDTPIVRDVVRLVSPK